MVVSTQTILINVLHLRIGIVVMIVKEYFIIVVQRKMKDEIIRILKSLHDA